MINVMILDHVKYKYIIYLSNLIIFDNMIYKYHII